MGGAKLKPSFWHYSGGLPYHWRALRYRKRLWRPFIELTQRWLEEWQVAEDKLLIVGPSAGYTLPLHWLARFRHIDILEPDPLARWLLHRRFPGIRFHSGEIDCFASSAGPAALREAYPKSAVLFSNVIGQVLGGEDSAQWHQELLMAMRGRSWATYHDVISTDVAPVFHEPVTRSEDSPLEDVLSCFWREPEIRLYDHACYRMVPQATSYGVWSITPSQHHLVAWNCMTVV